MGEALTESMAFARQINVLLKGKMETIFRLNFGQKNLNTKNKKVAADIELRNEIKKLNRKLNRKENDKRIHHDWYLKNKTIQQQKRKIYTAEHREEIAKTSREYQSLKLKTDINFKLIKNLRGRVYSAVKGLDKSASTITLVGCSIDELKNYLSSKFTEGMSFENYGKWHIDHIKPCASFDLSIKSEQKICFHYTNLQPLWAKDNLIKNNKVI